MESGDAPRPMSASGVIFGLSMALQVATTGTR